MRFWLALLLSLTSCISWQSHAREPVRQLAARATSEYFAVKTLLKQDEVVVFLREQAARPELVIVGTAHEQVVRSSATFLDILKLLDRLDGNIRAALDAVPPPPFDSEAASQLAASLSLQVLRDIPPQATLIFVSEVDQLRDIPFHILPVGKDPLSQSYDIAIAPSLEALRGSLHRRRSPLAALVGTPTFSDKLGAAIANNKYLRFPYMTVFSEEATETFVKENMPKASLIILAPHGWYD